MRKFVFVIVLALVAVSAYVALADPVDADEGTLSDDSGKCGGNVWYTFTSSTGTLSITGSSKMFDYNENNHPGWYSYKSEVKTVVIGEGVSTIGRFAFYECSSLTSITIPSSVSTIGNKAFAYCTSIKSVDIPDTVSSIGIVAFAYCSSLESIKLPNGLTTINNATFEGCTSLKSIDLPDSLTILEPYAFNGCSSLTSVTLPDKVDLGAGSAFALCSSISEFVVSENSEHYCTVDGVLFSKDKKTLIQYPINKAGSEYTISASVTSITSDAFVGCVKLKTIKVADGSSSFISDNGVLYSADKTVLVAYPAGKTDSVFEIPKTVTSIRSMYFFNGCDSLTEIHLSSYIGQIRLLGSAHNLVKIVVSDDCKDYTSIDGVVFSKNSSELLLCPAAKTGDYAIPEGTKKIGSHAFAFAGKLTSITIPDSITYINSNAFFGNVLSVEHYGLDSLCGISFGKGLDEIDADSFKYITFISDGEPLQPTVDDLKGKNFSVCQGTLETGFEVGHDYITHDAVDATRAASGNTLYYTCKYCDKVFKADKTTETTVLNETVYLVVFKIDDTEIETQVQYGMAPIYSGETPTKPSDEHYTYTFKGWSLNGTDIVDLTKETITKNNVTYSALFDSTAITYEIIFMNGEQELQRSMYAYGDTPVYSGPQPTRESTTQYSYEFKGWDKPLDKVTGPMTYYAVFNPVVNEYEVIFMNGDVPLQMSNVKYGEIPEYTKDTPTKASDAQYSYKFVSWDKPIVPVTGPMIYYAVFDSIVNEYEVVFMNGDVPLQMSNVKYGVVPVYSKATPTKASDDHYSYKFKGWDKPIVAVTGPVTYNAVFEAVPIHSEDSDSSPILFAIVIIEILAIFAAITLNLYRR